MIRTIAEWIEIFSRLDATNRSAEEAIAERIFGDTIGYRTNSSHRGQDVKQLANALQAYAKMLQDAGVKVVT